MDDNEREIFEILEGKLIKALDIFDKVSENLSILNERLSDLNTIVAPITGFRIKK